MEEKLCLKWHDFQENMKSSFRELKNDTDFADVTLSCEDGDFQVHKLILSTSSLFFRRVLKRTNKNLHPIIFMTPLLIGPSKVGTLLIHLCCTCAIQFCCTRMHRWVVTSLASVNISCLASRLRRSARRGKCCFSTLFIFSCF